MRNGQTPIHIQRWAPADFHADETVKLLKARRDYLKLTFYRTFLDESFMAGGDLPADPESLAAVMSMPVSHVKQALSFFIGLKIFEENGRLFQPRIRRDVADELEFREIQRANGKKGGRKASLPQALPNAVGKPKDSQSPPAPIASALRLSPAPQESPVAVEFDLLWAACTRKAGPDQALKTYTALRKSGSLPPVEVVIASLVRLQASEDWKRDGRKYQPHLSTWLNRGGWKEEPRESGPAQGATSGTPSAYGIDDETRARLEARHRRAVEESRRDLEQPDSALPR